MLAQQEASVHALIIFSILFCAGMAVKSGSLCYGQS